MQAFRIGLCQCRSAIGTAAFDPRPQNLERLADYAQRAKQGGAALAVFGELYLTGYRSDAAMYRYVVAPSDTDPWIEGLTAIAANLDIWLLLGTATVGLTAPSDMYNSAVLIAPEGLAGVYHKTHVASFPIDDQTVASERSFYSPGCHLDVYQTPFAKLGVQICYDAHFPEVSRVLALKGAEVAITLSAAVAGFERFWDVLLPVRAEENRIWTAMCSVVGMQADTRLFGGSRVVSPLGETVRRAPDNEEKLLVCDIDPGAAHAAQLMSHRFSTRRPELYRAITDPISDD